MLLNEKSRWRVRSSTQGHPHNPEFLKVQQSTGWSKARGGFSVSVIDQAGSMGSTGETDFSVVSAFKGFASDQTITIEGKLNPK